MKAAVEIESGSVLKEDPTRGVQAGQVDELRAGAFHKAS
jgi:hypothetical protein